MELIVQKIGSQLKKVARRDTDIIPLINLVRSESTSDVYIYRYEPIERYPKHVPDASFAHVYS